MVTWPLGRPPRVINDAALAMQIRRVVNRPEVSAAMIAESVKRICLWYQRKDNFAECLGLFLDILQTMNSQAPTTDAPQALVVRSNSVGIALARFFAMMLPFDDSNVAILARLLKDTKELFDAGLGLDSFYPKVHALCQAYEHRRSGLLQLRRVPESEIASWQEALTGIDVDAVSDEIAVGIDQLRAYGVKPCVFNDGLLQPAGTSWVFGDGYDLRRTVDPDGQWDFLASSLAVTILTPEHEVRRTGRVAPSTRIEVSGQARMVGFGLDVRALLSASIYEGGRMTADPEIGVIPLDMYFAQSGRRAMFPIFRLIHLLRLYDLVVPVEAMRQAALPGWPGRPVSEAGRQPRQARREPPERFFRTLVVPRLRLLGDTGALDRAMAHEVDDARRLTERLTTKLMDRHDIVGFLRPLPLGRRATDRARTLALQERGIAAIPEGYTYVKNHSRGSQENGAVGHIARRRVPL